MSKLRTKFVSAAEGYRLPPERREEYFRQRYASLSKFKNEIAEMYNEPALLDDTLRGQDFIRFLVTGCETLISLLGDKVVAIAVIHVRQPERSAELLAWIAPEFRIGFRNQKMVRLLAHEDLFAYLWSDLKLIRVETRCAGFNRAAIMAVKNLGFRAIGVARMDLRIQGQLFDSVVLELVNPAYEIPPELEKEHGTFATAAESSVDADHDERHRSDIERAEPAGGSSAGGFAELPDSWGESDGETSALEPADYSE